MYNENYVFESITKNKNLPDEVLELKPQNVENNTSPNRKVINLSKYSDVKVEHDTWTFLCWFLKDGDVETPVVEKDGILNTVIDYSDVNLLGKWKLLTKYNIIHEFKSATDKVLPEGVLSILPKSKKVDERVTFNVEPKNFDDVLVEGGKWIFKGWNVESVEVNEDFKFIGT